MAMLWDMGYLEQQWNDSREETRRFSVIVAQSDQRGVDAYTRLLEEAYYGR